MIKKILIYLAGFMTPFGAGYVFLSLGGMPVATQGKPLPLEGAIVKIALRAALKDHIQDLPPFESNESHLLHGATLYRVNCEVCHGLSDTKPSFIADGLFPKPPELFSAKENVTDDPVGKIYWKVKNGIRLTGMPGFIDHFTETELWETSLLLQQADKLPESVQRELRSVSR
jgi:thiosulfate dehydrogenase